MTPPIALALVLVASLAWGGQGQPQVLRDLGPDKSLCVCSFRLGWQWGKGGGGGGLIGWAIDANNRTAAYVEELSAGFRSAYDEMLSGTGGFQLLPSERFIAAKDGKPFPLVAAAGENGLFACLKADPVLGFKAGFSKRVKVETKWQLVGPSGWTFDTKTETVSEEGFGVSVDVLDPVLKPVFLHLARHSAVQFLEKLNEMMKAAGSSASMTMVDPDAIDARTLVDPGALPQPDPDCRLNEDGKWEKVVQLTDGVAITLVHIPEGSFLMGSPDAFDDDESRPRHEVTVGRAFWMGKYEVTQEQWKTVLASSPSRINGESFPVESVSWNDCKRFLEALNKRLGLPRQEGFRLPTEAEWEYAARAGTEASYSLGESARNLGQYAWFEKNSKKSTHRVGLLRPNPWGLYDIYGNVAEWCEDVWSDDYVSAPADGSARQGTDTDRVWRGGSWDHAADELRSYFRNADDVTENAKTLGFRLVLPAKAK